MKYQIYFWDLDGTLANTFPGIRGGILYAAKKMNLPPLPEEVIPSFIGPPLTASFRKTYGLSEKSALEMLRHYREYYLSTGAHLFRLYDGVQDTLRRLKEAGKQNYVVSSKPTPQCTIIIEKSGLSPYFDGIYSATPDNTISKKTDVIRYALSSLSLTHEDGVVMIGDTDNDILGAHDHGLPSIAVSYGFGTKESVAAARPTYTVDTPTEILTI